jgi:hypothetical protein
MQPPPYRFKKNSGAALNFLGKLPYHSILFPIRPTMKNHNPPASVRLHAHAFHLAFYFPKQ